MKYYTSSTEFNCGIDLHARQMYVCVMDRQGKKRVHTNVKDNDFSFFLKLVEPYRHDLTVCCECMFGWYWLADACQDVGLTFVLAMPSTSKSAKASRSRGCGDMVRRQFSHWFSSSAVAEAVPVPTKFRATYLEHTEK